MFVQDQDRLQNLEGSLLHNVETKAIDHQSEQLEGGDSWRLIPGLLISRRIIQLASSLHLKLIELLYNLCL